MSDGMKIAPSTARPVGKVAGDDVSARPKRQPPTPELRTSTSEDRQKARALLGNDKSTGAMALLNKQQVLDGAKPSTLALSTPETVTPKPEPNQRTDEERRVIVDNMDKRFYTPFAGNTRFKAPQSVYLPKDNGGVCMAMSMHWMQRSLTKSKPSFANSGKQIAPLDADQGLSSPRMEKKFAKYISQQATHQQDASKLAQEEGLQLVGFDPSAKITPKKHFLFIGAEAPRGPVRVAELNLKSKKDALGSVETDWMMAQMEYDEAKSTAGRGLKRAKLMRQSGVELLDNDKIRQADELKQQTVNAYKPAILAFKRARTTHQTERPRAMGEIDTAREGLEQAKLARMKIFSRAFADKLEPDKTYMLSFGGPHGAHAVAVRTGPAQKSTVSDGDSSTYASLTIMDPNIGEFHFDNSTPTGRGTKRDFLHSWGNFMFHGKEPFDNVMFHEAKPI